MKINLLWQLIFSFCLVDAATADIVCVKARLINNKVKLTSQTIPGDTCPKKFSKIFDTTQIDATSLADIPRARVVRRATQSIPDITITPIDFDTEEFDTASMYPGTGSVITIQRNGVYAISGTAHWTAGGLGSRTLRLVHNGTLIDQSSTAPVIDGPSDSTIYTTRTFQAGDQLSLEVTQSQGTSENLFNPNVPGYDLNAASFTVVWVGN